MNHGITIRTTNKSLQIIINISELLNHYPMKNSCCLEYIKWSDFTLKSVENLLMTQTSKKICQITNYSV
jgi:hypothetical protein